MRPPMATWDKHCDKHFAIYVYCFMQMRYLKQFDKMVWSVEDRSTELWIKYIKITLYDVLRTNTFRKKLSNFYDSC